MDHLTSEERRLRSLRVLSEMDLEVSPEEFVERFIHEHGSAGEYAVDFAIGEVWSRSGLSRRDRSLITITFLVTLQSISALRFHLGVGLSHGLKSFEIEEIMVQLTGYAGFPRAIEGIRVAREIFTDQGIEVEYKERRKSKNDDERRADARSVFATMTTRVSLDIVGVDMGSFTGSAGRFAFGDLWARGELSRRDRSLVVIATLVAQKMTKELRFHLGVGFTHGITIRELEELMAMSAVYLGFPTAVEGFRILREISEDGSVS